ncbi:MAG: hypothetical protein WHT29_11305, partial [Bacteroidales bacterium]
KMMLPYPTLWHFISSSPRPDGHPSPLKGEGPGVRIERRGDGKRWPSHCYQNTTPTGLEEVNF